MKSFFKVFSISFIIMFALSCDNDDDNINTATRSADKIEIIIDNGAPLSYSINIMAVDVPLSPTSGFSCMFQITSDDVSSNMFELTLGPTVDSCPFTIAVPTTAILTGSEITVFNIQGVDIDYNHASNSITMNYQLFGTNTGDDIKITFSGTYYDSIGNPHSISGDIDIEKN